MIGFGLDSPGLFLLPRPFSVGWRSPDGRIGLLVRVFGPGTARLASLRERDRVLLVGPLGRGFHVAPDRRVVCVAGGVGLAPFIFQAERARAAGLEVQLLYGERTASSVFDLELIEELTRGPVEVWTEDGTAGREGRVIEGLELTDDPTVLACGPTPMLEAMARLARERGASLQVAVEEYMGCGVGTCQGCVVKGADGSWIKSCTEGPVFDARELAWPS